MAPRPSSTCTKRLLQELSNNARATEAPSSSDSTGVWLDRLGPIDEEHLLHWEAVIRGTGLGKGYENGRWRLDVVIPTEYPNRAPTVKFVNGCCHANVDFKTGEICLDLLKDSWSPAYTILTTIEAIRHLLIYPEVDSPLNVDLAALIRQGDTIGAEGLVRYYTETERYEGR